MALKAGDPALQLIYAQKTGSRMRVTYERTSTTPNFSPTPNVGHKICYISAALHWDLGHRANGRVMVLSPAVVNVLLE